jgi:hypothetical protein
LTVIAVAMSIMALVSLVTWIESKYDREQASVKAFPG